MRVGWLGALRAGLAEVVMLRDAERRSRSYGEERLARIREKKREAAAHLRSARRLANPEVALSVLDVALPSALSALHEARGAETPFDAEAELAWVDKESPVRPPEDTLVAVRRRHEPGKDFADAETVRDGVDHLVAWVLGHVESRTALELHALRYGRIAGIALGFLCLAYPYARDHYLVHDVALHKPVITSPLRNVPNADGVVDGRRRGTYGVHTAEGKPFVMIDLEREYAIRSVRVYNRGDGWFDDVLPLKLSISNDGSTFEDVATRTTHFDVWTVELGGRKARYVRVSKDSGYIALNEIEVYARE